MILYDGTGDDARVVGLSYYIRHAGDAEPTQGFTGDNDHFHRHVGLCIERRRRHRRQHDHRRGVRGHRRPQGQRRRRAG